MTFKYFFLIMLIFLPFLAFSSYPDIKEADRVVGAFLKEIQRKRKIFPHLALEVHLCMI